MCLTIKRKCDYVQIYMVRTERWERSPLGWNVVGKWHGGQLARSRYFQWRGSASARVRPMRQIKRTGGQELCNQPQPDGCWLPPGPLRSISMYLNEKLDLERVAVLVQVFACRVYHELGDKSWRSGGSTSLWAVPHFWSVYNQKTLLRLNRLCSWLSSAGSVRCSDMMDWARTPDL